VKAWTTRELEVKLQVPRSRLLVIITRLQARNVLPPAHGRIRIPVRLIPAIDRFFGGGAAW